jgi:hypothetical protein
MLSNIFSGIIFINSFTGSLVFIKTKTDEKNKRHMARIKTNSLKF